MTRPAIDELEMLNPMELGELLIHEVSSDSRSIQYIQDLISVGCPIEPRDIDGQTPLHYAAQGKLEVLKFLISLGSDIQARDDYGRTALHIAAGWGQLEIAKYLISEGIDANCITNKGYNPIYFAICNGFSELIYFFMSIPNQTSISSDLV